MVAYVLVQAVGDFSLQPSLQGEIAGEVIALPANLPVVGLDGPGHRRGASYIGTAFAVGPSDDWLTARHVTDGCRDLALKTSTNRFDVQANILHRSADIARLDAGHPDVGSFAVLNRDQASLPDHASGHGFPQGRSEFVSVRLLADIKVDDPRSGIALGAVWHVDRYPKLPVAFDLGGLSGGPLIDPDGFVRGIIVGSDPRRSRLVTIDPIYAMSMSDANQAGIAAQIASLDPFELDQVLKDAGLVRLVSCQS